MDGNGHGPVGVLELKDPPSTEPNPPDYSELGSTNNGQTIYGEWFREDYNPKLRGIRGLQTYDQMRKSDGQVRGTLKLVKSPLLSADWYIEPFSHSQLDLDIAEAVEWALFEGMSRTWIQVLQEALLMLDYGYYIFEKVWKVVDYVPKRSGANTRPLNVWKKFAPRPPISIAGWLFDDNGGIKGIKHRKLTTANGQEVVDIPIEKLLIFTNDEEANDPQGTSILRSAYPHWYIKQGLYKIDAIQKERHAIGVPRVTMPPGYSTKDMTLAQQIGRNLRTNEKAFVVTPPGWEIEFIKLDTSPVNVLQSVDHHNHQIANNVLASFVDLGASQSGSRAVGDVQSDIFLKALRYMGALVSGVINAFAIPEMVNYNWKGVKGYPQLKVRRIGENIENRNLSVAVANYAKAGVLTPDAELEDFIRMVNDLPMMGEDAQARTVEDRLAVKQVSQNAPVEAPVAQIPQPDPNAPQPTGGGGNA
jgi:hypothetical protein